MVQKFQKQKYASPKERAENYRGLSILTEEKLGKNDYIIIGEMQASDFHT